jgi:hypothetical protein
MMEEEYLTILKHEFSAEEGSFLLQLRVRYRWDKSAFDRLTEAMGQCCKHSMPDHSTQETALSVQPMLFPLRESLQKQFGQAQMAPVQHIQAEEMLVPRWLAEGFGMSGRLYQLIPPIQPGKSNVRVNKNISTRRTIVWKVSPSGSSLDNRLGRM